MGGKWNCRFGIQLYCISVFYDNFRIVFLLLYTSYFGVLAGKPALFSDREAGKAGVSTLKY